MNKKELLSEISNVLEKEENEEVLVNSLAKRLLNKIFKLNFIQIIIYITFLLLSVLLFDKIDHLSFISEDYYVVLLEIFITVSVLIFGLFLTLYIYNRKKNNIISQNGLKNTYKFYQIFDLFNFISTFITIFLWIVIFVVTPVEVSGDSMLETFHDKDKILVWHIGYESKVSDVVIIDSENYLDTEFIIKRVIATEGDTLTYTEYNGVLCVNGVEVAKGVKKHEYQMMLTDKSNGNTYYDSAVVPEGYIIVLGDNFINSTDSRVIGLIKNEDVIGKCIFRIYPFSDFGVPKKK